VKLILDEMLSASIAEQLRTRGHDVIAVHERAELCGLSDAEIFALAQREDRAIVTSDPDFLDLDLRYRGRGRDHHGIVILHARRFPQRLGAMGRLVTSLDELLTAPPSYPSFVHWLP
jgi:predicted nuclease of predicted toxin-antitoxin system